MSSRGAPSTLILSIALVLGCSAATPTTTPTGSQAPPSATTPAPSETARPTPPPAPSATASAGPADLSARPLTWFAPLPPMPGRTGSADFMDQFTDAAPWAAAAGHVDVYKLYGEWVAYHATDQQLAAAVADIARRGQVLAVEAGPLDAPAHCGQDVESFAGADEGRLIAQRVIRAGGRIAVIAMDEPYFFGHVYDGINACHLDVEVIAANVASYVSLMRGYFPELIVGDIEPTPEPVRVAGIGEWLDAYERAVGEPLAFLHLDADWARPGWDELAHRIGDEAAARDVPLGMIYNGGSAPERGQWITLAGSRVLEFEASGGPPDHVIFQSWMLQPNQILPETDASTFSSLIVRYFEDHAALGEPIDGAGANLALRRPTRASAALPESPARAAVDGDFDTVWSSGADARQWIEIDLDGPQDVAAVRLTVSQFPAGQTEHRVLGQRRAGGRLEVLHTFSGATSDTQLLEFAPPEPWRGLVSVRIETLTSPSWVAWREIELLAP